MGNKQIVCCCANEDTSFLKTAEMKELSPVNNLEEETEKHMVTNSIQLAGLVPASVRTKGPDAVEPIAKQHEQLQAQRSQSLGQTLKATNAGEIKVYINRTPGDKLGLVICHFGELGILQVTDVKPRGLVASWNRVNPDSQVEIGAHILEMNGRKVSYMTEAEVAQIMETIEPIDMVCTRQRSIIPITED
eukprot:CAMPEP_0178444480 /NCGR_PEP_ID=MMETSP0689_2-20121128/39539_1 /TAXON_ID=160604 /ORGANISM="Amphidinium massartii, Strain CS-259" /LENGTH=189 /DNA_ID=CAMNT_0020068733 /DNA_START=84 /DNA_END=653 /DNA_ORIENTATION=+